MIAHILLTLFMLFHGVRSLRLPTAPLPGRQRVSHRLFAYLSVDEKLELLLEEIAQLRVERKRSQRRTFWDWFNAAVGLLGLAIGVLQIVLQMLT